MNCKKCKYNETTEVNHIEIPVCKHPKSEDTVPCIILKDDLIMAMRTILLKNAYRIDNVGKKHCNFCGGRSSIQTHALNCPVKVLEDNYNAE